MTVNTARSLRSLTAAATVTHFFDKDKTLLSKVYYQGILPVRVVNDIYCEWARNALAETKTKLEAAYEIYTKDWRAMKIAQEQLAEQEITYRRDESLIAQLRHEWEKRVTKIRAYYAFHKAENEKLKEVDAVFKPRERDAIMNASKDWEMQTILDELWGQANQAELELQIMPIRFNTKQGDAQIKISEVDESCL